MQHGPLIQEVPVKFQFRMIISYGQCLTCNLITVFYQKFSQSSIVAVIAINYFYRINHFVASLRIYCVNIGKIQQNKLLLHKIPRLMRRIPHILVLVLLAFSFSIQAIAQAPFVVVIDAGHGGKDPGAVNGRNLEKTINLNVALRVGALITANCKNVKVIYTRKDDNFVELHKRADIANKAKADLFISIHTNSADNKTAHGAETYLLGAEEKRTSANLSAAAQENKVILYESDYQTNYEGYDPNHAETMIIFEFIQNAFQRESLKMAQFTQSQLTGYSKRADRGVRQAGYLVLMKSTMPSILVELGYISNDEECKYMISKKGIEELSQSIYRGFRNYLSGVREKEGLIKSQTSANTVKTDKTDKTDKPVFKIQFLASKELIKDTDPRFKGIKGIEHYKENGSSLYKYTCGATNSYQQAKETLSSLKQKFPDAFLIAFRNGERIPVDKAVSESK